jgi:hypothetical protein
VPKSSRILLDATSGNDHGSSIWQWTHEIEHLAMDRSSSIAVQFATMIPETKDEMQRALCAQTSRKALSLCVSLWLFII